MTKEKKINLLRTVVIKDNNKEYVSSEYNNVSVCIKVSNLFNIINTVVKDKTLCKGCKNILISTIKEHKNLTNIIRLNNDILSLFDTNTIPPYFNTLSCFINDYNDRNKVFEKYYNVYYASGIRGKKQNDKITKKDLLSSIFFEFDVEIFNSLYNLHEDWNYYEIAYRYYFILSLMLNTFEKVGFNLTSDIQNNLFQTVKNQVDLSVVVKFEAYADFDLGANYGELHEELSQLSALNDNELVFKRNLVTRALTITIKDSGFLSDAYGIWKGGFLTKNDIGKKINITTSPIPYVIKRSDVTVYNYNPFVDEKEISTIRMTQDLKPNIKRVIVKIVGMRDIARVISTSGDAKDKVFANELQEHSINPDNMIACLLWRILWRTKEYQNDFRGVYKSFHNTYIEFIQSIEGNYDIATKTALIILLSQKTKEEQEEFIKSHKLNYRTVKDIESGIKKLNRMVKKAEKQMPELIRFMEGLKKYAY